MQQIQGLTLGFGPKKALFPFNFKELYGFPQFQDHMVDLHHPRGKVMVLSSGAAVHSGT
jgi:hypothetical protein